VVSDAPTACVDEPVVLLFAADADFVPLPLQAVSAVAIAIEKRIERFIFRGWYLDLERSPGASSAGCLHTVEEFSSAYSQYVF
jgi:hypothetical protein